MQIMFRLYFSLLWCPSACEVQEQCRWIGGVLLSCSTGGSVLKLPRCIAGTVLSCPKGPQQSDLPTGSDLLQQPPIFMRSFLWGCQVWVLLNIQTVLRWLNTGNFTRGNYFVFNSCEAAKSYSNADWFTWAILFTWKLERGGSMWAFRLPLENQWPLFFTRLRATQLYQCI